MSLLFDVILGERGLVAKWGFDVVSLFNHAASIIGTYVIEEIVLVIPCKTREFLSHMNKISCCVHMCVCASFFSLKFCFHSLLKILHATVARCFNRSISRVYLRYFRQLLNRFQVRQYVNQSYPRTQEPSYLRIGLLEASQMKIN